MNIMYFIIGLLAAILKFLFWGLWVELFNLLRDCLHGLRVIIGWCVKRGKRIIRGHDYE
jgi:hypothetical protein